MLGMQLAIVQTQQQTKNTDQSILLMLLKIIQEFDSTPLQQDQDTNSHYFSIRSADYGAQNPLLTPCSISTTTADEWSPLEVSKRLG